MQLASCCLAHDAPSKPPGHQRAGSPTNACANGLTLTSVAPRKHHAGGWVDEKPGSLAYCVPEARTDEGHDGERGHAGWNSRKSKAKGRETSP
ncbi:hypothetical protein VTK56DRAFT_3470 [Thermocarpiscus australiensis]